MNKLKTNWMTTLGGLLAGLPVLFTQAGIVLPEAIMTFIPAVGILLIGLAAKDGNVTGGTKKNV